MTTAVDFSFARMTAAQLHAGGVAGVARYVDYGAGNPKVITKAEYNELSAGGIVVALVFEDTANRAAAGYAAGFADGHYVEAFAASLGYPADGAIYFAVDYNEGAPANVLPYFQGLAAAGGGLFRRRPYGGADLATFLVQRGLTDAGWVSDASSWSHGVTTPYSAMQQLTTHSLVIPGAPASAWDQDTVLRADWARVSAATVTSGHPTVNQAPGTQVVLAAPIVTAQYTADGKGLYYFAADGGVFCKGDAVFYGSLGGVTLAKPIVSGAVGPSGYTMFAADGGVFSFGSDGFYGSMGGVVLAKPVVNGVLSTAGYSMFGADGGQFAFGNATYIGAI